MQPSIELTTFDLRRALERGVKLQEVESQLLRRMKLPAPSRTAAGPLYLLQQTAPELAELMQQWMSTQWQPPAKAAKSESPLVMAPVSPRGMDVPAYLKHLAAAGQPAVIAVDASPSEVGAALHYACSLPYALGIPMRVSHLYRKHAEQEMDFHPGDLLPELAVYCLQNGIPLLPLSAPQRLVASEFQFLYNQMMTEAQGRFAHESRALKEPAQLEMLASQLSQQVFNAGLNLSMEREDLVNRACYTASRMVDLARHLAARGYRHEPVLVLYRMQLCLDLPPLVRMFVSSPAALGEMYQPLDGQHAGSYAMQPLACPEEAGPAHAHTPLCQKMRRVIEKLLAERMQEKLTLAEVDELSSRVADTLRRHPLVERPPGVRGTLAMREIAQGLGLIRGAVTREALMKAAHVALSHRIRLVQGDDICIEHLLKSIFSRAICGIPLFPEEQEQKDLPRRAMTAEEAAQALRALSDAAFRELGPGESLPADDPGFAQEVMNHPLVQQALKEAMEKGLLKNAMEDYKDLLRELEDRGLLEAADASHMTLSKDGQERVKDSLQEALRRGDITPEELAEALKNSRGMPPPPGLKGESMRLTPQAEAELIAEMMDFQHQGRSESSSLEDLYIHYAVGEKKGLEVGKEKVDYDRLKVMIHELEKKGLIDLSGEKKRFTLSSLSLEKLLKTLIQRQKGQLMEKRAFKKEHETDRTDVRRYQQGDAFKDISMRHTLRRVLRKGKTIDDINQTDLRAFDKKPANQLDIAVCVDISASMKEGGKLRYAKMAVAELAKAAVAKSDRMGIVAFSNLGQEVVPLSDKLQPLMNATMTLRSEQYTNIGNGLRVARQMLQKDRNSNGKFIILITDGEPNAALSDDSRGAGYHARVAAFSRQTTMETKRAMGAQHALMESAKTRRKHIKISVVYICPEGKADQESERVAREIARIGGGRFHKVRAIEHLPLEALATVA